MKKVFSDFNDAGFSLIEVLVALFIVSVVITSVPSIIGMTSKLVIDSNNEKRNIETLICHVNGFNDIGTELVDEELSSDEISFMINGEENKIPIENKSHFLKDQPSKKLVTFNRL